MEVDLDSTSFIEKFHSLEGIKLKDRQHNLYNLFLQAKNLPQNELDIICANLSPKTYLEKIFRIDFLIYFQQQAKLYQEFQRSDEITCAKLAKHQWFYKNAFEIYSPTEFVNSVLPTMSYCTRLNILHNYRGKSEEENDKIFDLLEARYGIYKSIAWITKCSVGKINEIFSKYPEIRLGTNQLKTCFDREPILIAVYCQTREFSKADSWLLHYIARKNANLIVKLMEKGAKFYTLGRRNTRKFIKAKKEMVLQQPKLFWKRLNSPVLCRTLGPDAKIFLECHFPREITSYYCQDIVYNLLQHYPPKIRFERFRTMFHKVFHKNIEDNLDAIEEILLEKVVTDPSAKEKLAKLKFEESGDYDWLEFYQLDTFYNEIVQKSATMEKSDFKNCVQIIANKCNEENDVQTWLKIATFLSEQFANDKYVIDGFLDGNILHTAVFTKTQWDWANKYQFSESHKIDYWMHLIRCNEQIPDEVFTNTEVFDNYYVRFVKNHEDFRQLLNYLLKSHQKIENEEHQMVVLKFCIEYCKKFAKFSLLEHQLIRAAIKAMVQHEDAHYMYEEYIVYLIKNEGESPYFAEFLEDLFNNLANVGTDQIVKLLLSKVPQMFEVHCQNFVELLSRPREEEKFNFWHLLRKFAHLNIDKKMLSICSNRLQKIEEANFDVEDEEVQAVEKLILPLSYFMPAESFEAVVVKYIPDNPKVDMSQDVQRHKFDIQKKIVVGLTQFKTPIAVLPLVLKFCKGDYLKYALTPLYRNMYRLNENRTDEFIRTLDSEKAVSVKKHGLLLCCEIKSKDTIYQMMEASTVHLLICIMRYFIKNPSERTWKIFESKLKMLEKHHEPFFQRLISANFPSAYSGRFFMVLWQKLTEVEFKHKNQLLERINVDTGNQLGGEFVAEMIEKWLFNAEDIQGCIAILIVSQNNLNWSDNLLKALIEVKTSEKWYKLVPAFINYFTEVLLRIESDEEREIKSVVLVDKMMEILLKVFELEQVFKEVLILNLVKLKCKDNLDETLPKYQIELANEFGEVIVCNYQSVFVDFIERVVGDESIDFSVKLLNNCKHPLNYLMLLDLMPKQKPTNGDDGVKYDQIIKAFVNAEDAAVKVAYYIYLNSNVN